ncbi:hypothetical protein WJX81_004824 [Elliptochloris bilobata]|uniref:Isoprenylcysteine carboxylmethyltransferase family protein n=1 Tax=Elliptochloris bilobata TaxID=381761 RepID=A0AAW1S0F7_9CHLO
MLPARIRGLRAVGDDSRNKATISEAPEQSPASFLPAEGQALLAELLDPAERGSRGEGWVAAQVAALALVLFPPGVLRTLVNDFGVVLMVAGAVLIVGGVADIRLENLTPLPKPRPGGKLVTSGVYSYVRHPMYAGLLAFAFGLAAFTGDEARAAMAVALAVILSLKVDYEERELEAAHPNDFPPYRERVKKFIPFIF